MSRVIRDAMACQEALARLPELDLGELRQQWRALYKTKASPHLSRELLLRAVAYRMQELGRARTTRVFWRDDNPWRPILVCRTMCPIKRRDPASLPIYSRSSIEWTIL